MNKIDFLNAIESISLAGWDNSYAKSDKHPTQLGDLKVTFRDGSVAKIPMSYWFSAKPENRRPNVSGCINTYVIRKQLGMLETFAGESPIDNPHLIDSGRRESHFENRDDVHHEVTGKRIDRKTRKQKSA